MTEPAYRLINPQANRSFVFKWEPFDLTTRWHYHPEIELLYCIKGKGTNFIGNAIRTIEDGELLLLGKNLPHTRQRDVRYYIENPDEKPESVVVQFRDDFLGDHFFELKEFAHVGKLFEEAKVGLKFYGSTLAVVARKLETIKSLNTTSAILELLSILDHLARSTEFEHLNSINYVSDAHEKYSQKINRVYHYTIEHFREPISLAQVAGLTNHSPAAFCRYFKTRTRKSYFEYLTEIRPVSDRNRGRGRC